MPAMRSTALLLTLFLALAATAARAFDTPPGESSREIALPGAVVRTGDPALQRALSAAPAWRDFASRNGGWKVVWNEVTGTPHRAFGAGIELDGFADDAAGADRAVRGFIARHPGLFGGSPALETAFAGRRGRVWYLRYRQTVGGVPVLFEDWEFRVGEGGRLFAFGADAHRVPAGVATHPKLVAAVVREAAKSGLRFDPATDRVEGGAPLYLLPYPGKAGTEYRLVYDVRVHTADPPSNFITLVDANDGAVLWRHDRVRFNIGGNVSGAIHPYLPTDALAGRNFAHLSVQVGAFPALTDAAGNYDQTASGTVTVSAQLNGQFCNVNRQDGADATLSSSAANPATVNFAWSTANSQDSERDAFYQVNIAHDYAKTIDPGFTGNDYSMPTAVNINATCNAYWDGTGVNFYRAGGGCPNTATMPDVVYHEYGHGVNDNLYAQAGAPFGLTNGAMHEGLADVNQAYIQDDPLGGKGFFGPGTFLRTADNTKHWPEDQSGDPHATGLIISGACWNLRQSVGLATAARLIHFAKYGTPDDANDGIAMNEFFVETLVADDDDANLSNGTPHSPQIIAAFNAHGIGTGFYITIAHAPLADQPTTGPYAVTANVSYAGPIGALVPSTIKLNYSLNGAPYATSPMTPTGNPSEYRAYIPATTAGIVRYYVEASDNLGGSGTSPASAPTLAVNTFLAGLYAQRFLQDQETDAGWVSGAVGDNATTGLWLRADPVGTNVSGVPVQPEDDHTPFPGVQCWVTGNAAPADPPGANDVDGGRTTLTTAALDAVTGGLVRPVISYYRWYSNNAGSDPGNDLWRADISNDGGASWTSVESTRATDNSWRRVLFFISDYVAPTASMRMRFIAEDAGAGSLIEAAVDDFALLDFAAAVSVGPGASPGRLALARPAPNPFGARTRLAYALPAAGRVELRIFDLGGRMVRTLVAGAQEAGGHAVEWDGRDDGGRAAPDGLYFARIEAGGARATQRVALMR